VPLVPFCREKSEDENSFSRGDESSFIQTAALQVQEQISESFVVTRVTGKVFYQ
jgi:hypothetical protein